MLGVSTGCYLGLVLRRKCGEVARIDLVDWALLRFIEVVGM